MQHKPKITPVSQALREAGFVPLPRLWVKSEDMPRIHEIAYRHQDMIKRVRNDFGQHTYSEESEAPVKKPSPIDDREAAWDAYERARG